MNKVYALSNAQAIADMDRPRDGDAVGVKYSNDGVAVIEVRGAMSKYPHFCGPSTLELVEQVESAVNDAAVSGIALLIDSPGGDTYGTEALAHAIAKAKTTKPVVAYVEDQCASAAYWIASQCTKIVASRGSFVGGIGTYIVLTDFSGMDAQAGVKTYIVRSGKFKGLGADGGAVSDEELSETQRIVDTISDMFIADVAAGRGMEAAAVQQLADGRVHVAEQAMRLGLIDEVGTFSAAVDAALMPVTKAPVAAPQGRSTAMAESKTAAAETSPGGATIEELKKSFPDSSAEWREKCYLSGLTLDQAKAWLAQEEQVEPEVEPENPEDTPQMKALNERLAKLESASVGTVALSDSTGAAGEADSKSEIDSLVAEQVKAGRPRHVAFAHVMRHHPELRKALVAEANAGRTAQA